MRQSTRASTDPTPFPRVSIVGVGCRATGTDFDHEWFGLDRLAAAGLTPRQRTNLEVAVEALDDSGLGCLAPGSHAAVVFGAAGGTHTANHLSRALELHGPSLTVDSQRASPLVAVDMGVRLLADEAVPFVIAGGVDLALLPDISDLRMPGHRTGSGVCTVLILQRTADAARTRTRRYADITGPGLGFQDASGLDPHIALDEPVRGEPGTLPDRGDEPPILIPVTGRDPATIHDLALRWAVAAGSYRSVREFAAATARLIPEGTRAAILARDGSEAAARLRALSRRIAATAANAPAPQMITANPGPHDPVEVFAPVREQRTGEILFLFPGSGDHPRMGRALAARYPVFATALTAATDAVVESGGPRVWTPRNGFRRTSHPGGGSTGESACSAGHGAMDPGGETGFGGDEGWGEMVFAHASLFVFQVALAELVESWGIRADGVAGHGVGEVAAAVSSGALELGAGARVVLARARLIERAGAAGAAAVLEATPAEVMRLVEPMRADVAVAAVDGPTTVTVSGEPRYVDALVRRTHRRAIFAQRIPAEAVPAPVHLPKVRARAAELRSELDDLAPSSPRRPLYSTTHRGLVLHTAEDLTPRADRLAPNSAGGPGAAASAPPGPSGVTAAAVSGGQRPDVRLDAEYWADNACGTVELAAALERAVTEGISTVLEIGPGPVLTNAVRERAALRDGAHAVLAREDEAGSFLRTVARLYLEGRAVDWTALGPHTTAPPQRQWRRKDFDGERLWAGGSSTAPAFPSVEIRPEGAYVVAGGLGAQGEAAVRWLLEAGARDVVVLTRTPRPLPESLAGMEDRIVVMRCDGADRTDLATALQDIRECGSAIRGVVHASGEARLAAAANLLELTAADPADFTVVLTPVPGPAESEAVRKLAAAQADRRVICVEWEVGPAA